MEQTECTIGSPFPPSSQGTTVTCLSLTSSHHRPCHFNPPVTLNMLAFLSPRAWPQAGFPSATPHTHASREGLSFFLFFKRRERSIFASRLREILIWWVDGAWETRTDLLSEGGRWQSQLGTSRCWFWCSPWPTQHPVNREHSHLINEKGAVSRRCQFCGEIVMKSQLD